MRITGDIHVVEQVESFDTRTVAHSKIEVEASWDEIKPGAVHNGLSEAIEDATVRVREQVSRIARTKREEELRVEEGIL